MRGLRTAWWVGFFLAWGATVVFGQSLCSFRMPVNSILDASVSFSYHYFDTPETVEIDTSSGYFSLSYDQVYDSPEFGYSIGSTSSVLLEDMIASDGWTRGNASYRYYFSTAWPLYVYSGLQWNATTQLPQIGTELRSGLGYGRFHDVTPLAKAHRIAASLASRHSVPAPLTSQTITAIAEQISRNTDSPVAELLMSIEAEIERATGTTLNGPALLDIEREIRRTGDDRFCGGIIQGGVGYELLDPYGEERNVLYVMSTDLAIAPDPSTQGRLRASIASPGDLLRDYSLLIVASYAALTSGTSEVTAGYTIQREHTPGHDVSGTDTLDLDWSLDLGGVAMVMALSLSSQVRDPAWTIDLSLGLSWKMW